jgi:hypothetical protein
VDLNAVFPHRAFISLARRKDRRGWLQARMADAGISAEWFRAVDAQGLRHPCGFKDMGRRANSLSFRFLIRRAERQRSPALLVFEDDAVFHPEFRERVTALALPEDWQIFYFGCQHLETPKPVSRGLVRVTRALDTHAVAFRASAYREVRKIMRGRRCGRGPAEQFNDVLLSALHKKLPTYAAFPNLVWQALGSSDLTGHIYSNYDKDGRQIPGAAVVRHLYK